MLHSLHLPYSELYVALWVDVDAHVLLDDGWVTLSCLVTHSLHSPICKLHIAVWMDVTAHVLLDNGGDTVPVAVGHYGLAAVVEPDVHEARGAAVTVSGEQQHVLVPLV